MENESIHGLRLDQLADVFSLGVNDPDTTGAGGNDERMAGLLRDQLSCVLPRGSLLFDSLIMMMGRLGCDVQAPAGRSLLEVLSSPHTDLGLLQAIKDCSKKLSLSLDSKLEALGGHSLWRHSAGYVELRDAGRAWLLHRWILRSGEGHVCDHINNDRRDNRRSNLRAVSQADNVRRGRWAGPPGHLRGVWRGRGGCWRASVGVLGRVHETIALQTPLLAALAHDDLVRRLGLADCLNFPLDLPARDLRGFRTHVPAGLRRLVRQTLRRQPAQDDLHVVAQARPTVRGRPVHPGARTAPVRSPAPAAGLRIRRRDKPVPLHSPGGPAMPVIQGTQLPDLSYPLVPRGDALRRPAVPLLRGEHMHAAGSLPAGGPDALHSLPSRLLRQRGDRRARQRARGVLLEAGP